jgi:hypothetical protein
MLTISAKQMATLKRRREQWFEEWIVTYLRDADPEYCAMLGDEAIAGVAQQAMEKTRQYGISMSGWIGRGRSSTIYNLPRRPGWP